MASAEIRGEFFRTNSRVNLSRDFLCIFGGLFIGKNREKKSTQNSTAEFGNFAANIHTARIWPCQSFGGGIVSEKFRRDVAKQQERERRFQKFSETFRAVFRILFRVFRTIFHIAVKSFRGQFGSADVPP